jgi:predicted HTH domain antitoxin
MGRKRQGEETNMEKLTIEYPEGLETAVATTRGEFEAQIRLMAALKMFELGKLSSGKAAQLAGISRVEFLEMCGRYHVPVIHYTAEEIEAELKQEVATLQDYS